MRCALRSLFCWLLIAALALSILTGCGHTETRESREVVCTSFAAYEWVREILGSTDALHPVLLVADGSDLHSYQPTVADKVRLSESALVVRVGGESDRWVDEMSDGVRVLCLSEIDGVTLRTAEILGGEGHDHAHVHEEGEHGHEHDHAAFDEHLWLSPQNAARCVNALCEELSSLDPENAVVFEKNANAYVDKLTALDASLAETCESAPRDTLLVADRFPFVYLVEEYGLSYCAAFSGCSTESQASFETVVRLAQYADEYGLSHLLVTEGSDGRLAKSVIAASQSQSMTVLALDSMQAVSAARAASVTYLSVMYENLEILKAALS